MSARADIEKRIERERQKIAELRSQIEKAESFIQGLQEALRLLPKDKENERDRMMKASAPTLLRPGSDVEKAYNLLQQKGKAIHISEILIGIGKEDTKANRMSLTGSLGRYVRIGQFFTRPLPNSFAAADSKEPNQAIPLRLPAEFGGEDRQI